MQFPDRVVTHSVGESGGVDAAGEGVGGNASSPAAPGSGVGVTSFAGAGVESLWGVTHAGCRTAQK